MGTFATRETVLEHRSELRAAGFRIKDRGCAFLTYRHKSHDVTNEEISEIFDMGLRVMRVGGYNCAGVGFHGKVSSPVT